MALTIEIKVVPSSGRNAWVRDKNGTLKCFLKNPPERNLANKELVKLLADALRLPQTEISIVSGETQRKKRVKIGKTLTQEQLLAALGIEVQSLLFGK